MKLRFIKKAPGRPEYQVGKIYDFDGPVAKTYADKYIEREWAVEVGKKQAAATVENADVGGQAKQASDDDAGDQTVDRSNIEIPDNWNELPASDLRTLADSLSDTPTRNKAEAIAAIETELARRAADAQ
ncbi:hypothetical protein EN742_02945 [Mesorhizobium sp. M4A.F.Ca.ET.020.02.1.1]|uniref:hypothetical protein n=1 Tax=Mesorhizobium sp. M4A.F.Ca.ET.020.02.1.1 TaxID=2496652 RepID=UPI000FD24A93|nr:hypothetical protein [Mesorhizobium sp. M4A.F.Ca.ET.020.02.1.1]RVD44202.1 hypothetical protein EN742_02945 [Mesorhizobium sp. M4A.F.Ca.ET.020.02.1.1]